MVKDGPTVLQQKYSPRNLLFAVCELWLYSQGLLRKSALKSGILPHSTAKNQIAQHCAAISAITEILLVTGPGADQVALVSRAVYHWLNVEMRVPPNPAFHVATHSVSRERRVRMSKKHRKTYVFHVQYIVNELLPAMFLPVLCEVANTKHSHWLAGLSVASHWESWVHLFRMHSVHFDPPSQSILIHTEFIEGESSKLCHMFGSQIWQSTCKFGVLSPKTWSPQTACFG